MSDLSALGERNTVLRGLPPDALAAVLERLEVRHLRLGAVLCAPGDPITQLVFPVEAVASMVAESEEGMSVEATTIGNEGLVGADAFLGIHTVTHRVICQMAGRALVGPVAELVSDDPASSLARQSRRFLHTLLTQASQAVLCNRLHPLEQRAARWLLMIHDRVGAPNFRLTHEFFAAMLGTHRPSVSVAAGTLQRAGLIRYTRGRVEILDVEGLLGASCSCYEIVLRNYTWTMGAATR